MLWQLALFHSFLWLSNIPLPLCTASSLPIHLLLPGMDFLRLLKLNILSKPAQELESHVHNKHEEAGALNSDLVFKSCGFKRGLIAWGLASPSEDLPTSSLICSSLSPTLSTDAGTTPLPFLERFCLHNLPRTFNNSLGSFPQATMVISPPLKDFKGNNSFQHLLYHGHNKYHCIPSSSSPMSPLLAHLERGVSNIINVVNRQAGS